MDMHEALYRREMGYTYDNEAYLRAAANGLAAGLRRAPKDGLRFPNYDGTDTPDALAYNGQYVEVVTNPDYDIESLDENKSPLEWLEIAGKRIDELKDIIKQQGQIVLTERDHELLDMIITVEQNEATTNVQLRDEHPKFTRAVDAWVLQEASDTSSPDSGEYQSIKIDTLDRIMVELNEEVGGFERELQWLQQWGEQRKRQAELSDGIEYFYGLIDVCQHQRLEALAAIERATLEKLYALAA